MTLSEYQAFIASNWPGYPPAEWSYAARTLLIGLIDRHCYAEDAAILKKFLEYHIEMAFRAAPTRGVPLDQLAPAAVLLISSSHHNPER